MAIRKASQARQVLTRRQVLRLGSAAAGTAVTGPFVWTPARAQGFTWRRFQGTELFVMMQKHPWVGVVESHLPEFESLTGIKVRWEAPPDTQSRQKITVALTSGAGGMDAFFTGLAVEKKRFWKAGWYTPLNRFLEDRSLTSPEYDWNDFAPAVKGLVTQPDRSISALPAYVDPIVLFYRKDLYAQKGLTPPKTLDELERHAALFHAPPGLFGFVARGRKNASAPAFSMVLFGMGGSFLTPDGKAALDTKECIAAINYYSRMLKLHAPPGVVNFNWYEASAAFQQGQVALYLDNITFGSLFEDASKSKIAGKVAYALPPAGPAGQFSPIFGTGMAISAHSQQKEAAYLFIQWATSKQNGLRELLAGVPTARTSPWEHPEIKAKPTMPAEFYSTFNATLKIGREGLPAVAGVNEYRDIIGVAIVDAAEGAPAAQVAARAQKEFQEMLNRTEG